MCAPAIGVADLKQSFLDNLFCGLGRVPMAATRNDAYTALALTVRDRVFKQGVQTMETYAQQDARVVAYLSAEFLPGRICQQAPQPGPHRECAPGDGRTRHEPRRPGRAGGRTRARQRRPGPARVLLPGFACLAGSARPSATASVTSSASSTRSSRTAGRWRSPTSGCAWATRGRSPGPKSPTR